MWEPRWARATQRPLKCSLNFPSILWLNITHLTACFSLVLDISGALFFQTSHRVECGVYFRETSLHSKCVQQKQTHLLALEIPGGFSMTLKLKRHINLLAGFLCLRCSCVCEPLSCLLRTGPNVHICAHHSNLTATHQQMYFGFFWKWLLKTVSPRFSHLLQDFPFISDSYTWM